MTDIRVLLVDDEQDFLRPLVKRLTRRSFTTRAAAGGREAVDMLGESPADVVVLDVRMPDMDGLTTLMKIKEMDPGVEVILLTGHASLEVAREGLRQGAFDYMMKPVDIEELIYRVEDAFQRKTLRENGGRGPGAFAGPTR